MGLPLPKQTNDRVVKKDGADLDTTPDGEKSNSVQLRREIGLMEAVAITIGAIIGSGIFVSPKGVLIYSGSIGMSLIVWVVSGFLSMTGAMCYAELGTSFPGSGGTYLYLQKAYGPICAFLYLWICITITAPCSMAILSLTFAKYVVQVFFPIGAELPSSALTLVAASTISLIIFINCYDIRGAMKAQNIFMVAKISALILIIILGFHYLCQGHVSNFSKPFENTITDPGSISLAFFSGFFSYSGWAALNFMTEEMKDPNKNLPRAIRISIPLVTLIYVLANVAYFSVLSPSEMRMSDAIAVTFGQKLYGFMAWIMSLCVAISTFGALAIHTMTVSRLFFVAARGGHCPAILSHIKISTLSPAPSLVFLGFTSLFYLSTSDIYALINYAAFVDNFANFGVVIGLLYMRKKYRTLHRPIKAPLIYPIIYLITCAFAVCLPIYVQPIKVSIAVVMSLTGLPVFYLFIAREQPKWLAHLTEKFTTVGQKIFVAVAQDD